MTIRFLQFLKDQKELEEVFIKKLFDYKLSSAKFLPTVNWSELVVTTVDTLWWMVGSVNGGFDWRGEDYNKRGNDTHSSLEKQYNAEPL